MQLIKLNQFQPLSYGQLDIASLPGNIMITLQLGDNHVTFKSFVLKNNENCQHYYINFLLNYYEAFSKCDNNYHLEFQMCYFELQPLFYGTGKSTQQRGYRFKNLKENFDIKHTYDQIIAVATYKEMYFLYVIMLSRGLCYILDPQIKPQSRFTDHEHVAKQLLEYFQQSQQLKCFLLKEVKSEATSLIRSALILDFIYMYIDDSNNVEKIENIKIGSSTAKKMIDRINWFVYKCYTDNIFLVKLPKQQPKFIDKLLTYDEWKDQLTSNSFEKVNKIKNVMKQKNDLEKSLQFNKSNSSISILSLMGQNQLKNNSSNNSQSAIEINAQSFMSQMIYEDVRQPAKSYQVPKTPVDAISKQEFEMLLREAKQQIRQEVIAELQQEQEERMKLYEQKLQNKYNPLDEQIAQEYLTQVKFQRYKEYLDYLMEYYYNNDRQEYYKLIDQYNQRLKDTALNGMVEVQKQEMLKLQSITKKKIVEQNQQLELALYNQKKELEHIMPQKKKVLEAAQLQKHQVATQQGEYRFQFANVNLTIDPYEFKTEQQVEEIRKQRTALDDIDLSNTQIQEMENAWKFDQSRDSVQHSVYNYDEELERLKSIYEIKKQPILSKRSLEQSNPPQSRRLQEFQSKGQLSQIQGSSQNYNSNPQINLSQSQSQKNNTEQLLPQDPASNRQSNRYPSKQELDINKQSNQISQRVLEQSQFEHSQKMERTNPQKSQLNSIRLISEIDNKEEVKY